MGQYFDVTYMVKSFPILLASLNITLTITIVATILGILLGCLIAIARVNRVPVLRQALTVYVSFMRGTPFLVQLFLIYFGVPEILSHMGISTKNVPGLLFVIVVFTLHIGAYSSEILRSSIQAVAQGEKEAAMSLGMTSFQSYRRVILPQAFTMAIPPLINSVIGMMKGTSLIFNVGVVDIMRRADLMGANSQRSLELFVDVAIIYGLLVLIISLIGRFLERRYSISERVARNTARTAVSKG